MAAGLGAMVTKLSKQESASFEADRAFFSEAVERDSEAFQHVMAAYKRPKEERAPFVEEAMQGAAEVPLQVVERASALLDRLHVLQIPARMASDLLVATGLLRAAREGALENVKINLDSIQDEEFKAAVKARLTAAGVA